MYIMDFVIDGIVALGSSVTSAPNDMRHEKSSASVPVIRPFTRNEKSETAWSATNKD